MKFKYLLSISALLLSLVGCQQEIQRDLASIKVSSSYVGITPDGGNNTITIDVTDNWTITDIPEWLSVDPASGASGSAIKITFTAGKADATRESELKLVCGSETKTIRVLQMTEKVDVPFTTIAELLANPVYGKTYRMRGVVTSIESYDKYGKFMIKDDSSDKTVLVYGSANHSKFPDLAVGDEIEFEGPWSTYDNFDSPTVILNVIPSLIKLNDILVAGEPLEGEMPLEGGVLDVCLTVKGDGFKTVIPEEAKSWLNIEGVSVKGNDNDVTIAVAPNAGGTRKVELTFVTTKNGKEYSAVATIAQSGAIQEVTVAEFLAAPVGDALYKLSGKIESITGDQYGNFYLQDNSGRVYVYGLTATPVEKNDKSFPSLGLRQGDYVTIIGTRGRYEKSKVEDQKDQVAGPAYLVSSVKSTDASISEFLAKPVASTFLESPYYRLTGIVKEIVNDQYGNIYLKEKDSDVYVYVYGLTVAPVAKNDKSFNTLGVKVGDEITIVGQRGQYAKSKVEDQKEQVANAYLVAIKEGEGGEVTPPTPPAGSSISLKVDGFPDKYPTEETELAIAGITYAIFNVANYGKGIQMKKEGSYIFNKTAFPFPVKKITLKRNAEKKWYADNLKVYAGNSANPAEEVALASSDDNGSVYNVSGCTYIKISNPSNYAVNMDEIIFE